MGQIELRWERREEIILHLNANITGIVLWTKAFRVNAIMRYARVENTKKSKYSITY